MTNLVSSGAVHCPQNATTTLLLPDFGTEVPKAAIIWGMRGGTENVLQNSAFTSHGIMAGNAQYCLGVDTRGGEEKADSSRKSEYDRCVDIRRSDGGSVGAFVGTFVPGGITFTPIGTQENTEGSQLHVVLLGGSGIQAHVSTNAAAADLAITDCPFTPNSSYHLSGGLVSSFGSSNWELYTGMIVDTAANTKQGCIMTGSVNGNRDSRTAAYASRLNFMALVGVAGTAISHTCTWTAYTASGMTWSLTGTSGTNAEFHTLFLRVENEEVNLTSTSVPYIWQAPYSEPIGQFNRLGAAINISVEERTGWETRKENTVWGYSINVLGHDADSCVSMAFSDQDGIPIGSLARVRMMWSRDYSTSYYGGSLSSMSKYLGYDPVLGQLDFLAVDRVSRSNNKSLWLSFGGDVAAGGSTNVKLGELDVDAIYLGSTPVDALYLGTEQIF